MRERNRWTKLQELYFCILLYQTMVSGNKQEWKITYIQQHQFDFECISRRSIHEQSRDSPSGHLSGPCVLIAPPSPDLWTGAVGCTNQRAGKYPHVGASSTARTKINLVSSRFTSCCHSDAAKGQKRRIQSEESAAA